MALFQGIKKLIGPLLDDLECARDVKDAVELQVEALACDSAVSRDQEALRPSAR
jgi:hypothetical protein